KQAEDLAQAHRYNAACNAALAAAGQGKDAGKLARADRLALRRQALTWLRAELTARQKQLQSPGAGEADRARAALRHWQTDPDLAGLRDAQALHKLSAEEREACRRLWADVRHLLALADTVLPAPALSPCDPSGGWLESALDGRGYPAPVCDRAE